MVNESNSVVAIFIHLFIVNFTSPAAIAVSVIRDNLRPSIPGKIFIEIT